MQMRAVLGSTSRGTSKSQQKRNLSWIDILNVEKNAVLQAAAAVAVAMSPSSMHDTALRAMTAVRY